jgi:hypothetical protein
MQISLTLRDRSVILLDGLERLRDANQVQDRYALVEAFYREAARAGEQTAEEDFRSASRERTSKFLTYWFSAINILALALVIVSFIYEMYNGTLGRGIITSAVLVSIIGATVAQTAAAFIIFAKYAFTPGKASTANSRSQVSAAQKNLRKPAKSGPI